MQFVDWFDARSMQSALMGVLGNICGYEGNLAADRHPRHHSRTPDRNRRDRRVQGELACARHLAPERLSRLQHVATIESIGSSTRIEGSHLTDREVETLLGSLNIQAFATRDEQQVAGYADVMELIFTSWPIMPLTEGTIRKLHRELLRHSSKDDWHRGAYKQSANRVAAFDGQGRQVGIVFQTAEPGDTPRLMDELLSWTNQEIAE
jgi:Fic family protein